MTAISRCLLMGVLVLGLGGCIPMLIHEAETPATEGRVLDGVDGEPVAGAQVTLLRVRGSRDTDPLKVTAVSDEEGRFLLEERSRRRVVMAMAGSHLAEFPMVAHEESSDRSAHTLVKLPSRSRAGSPPRPAVLLLLPDNPNPLPSDCRGASNSLYALHAAERLPEWREQAWFREQVLSDTNTLRQFADSLYELLERGFGSPDCFRNEEVVERVAAARKNVRMLIEEEPYYRSSRGNRAALPAPGSVRPGDYPAPEGYGSEVRFAGMKGRMAFVLDGEGVVSHVIFEPQAVVRGDVTAVEPSLSMVSEQLSGVLGGSPREKDWKHRVWDDPAQEHVYEAMVLDTAGGGNVTRVMLRSRDPARLCGSEDGFPDWFDDLQRAIVADRREAVANALDYPFLDHAGAVMGVEPEQRLHFDDATEFLGRYEAAAVQQMLAGLVDMDSPDCDPYGFEGRLAGYALPTAPGAIQAYPKAGEWRLVLRYYQP